MKLGGKKTHTKKQNQELFAKFVNVLVSAMDSRGRFKEDEFDGDV